MNLSMVKKKNIALFISTLLLVVSLLSIIYIVHEEHHDCMHEHCPICINIHQCENNIRLIGSWTIVLSSTIIFFLQILIKLSNQGTIIPKQTLVSKKVRLNN